MAENKKGKPQFSPTKKAGPFLDDDEGKEIFPELPSFFVDIHGLLKEDPVIREYEREYLYELELARVGQLSEHFVASVQNDFGQKKKRLSGGVEFALNRENGCMEVADGASNCVLGDAAAELRSEISLDPSLELFSKYKDPFASHYITGKFCSTSWTDYQHKAFEVFELCQSNDIEERKVVLEQERIQREQEKLLGSTPPPTPPPPRGDREKSAKVVKEFHHLFPSHDIIIRESEEISTTSLFCEAIAKEIVNRGADLYVSRCFEAIKEGYTANSVWEELRDTVVCSFLPQDFGLSSHPWKNAFSPSLTIVRNGSNNSLRNGNLEKSNKCLENDASLFTHSSAAFTTQYFADALDSQGGANSSSKQEKLLQVEHYMGQGASSALLLSAVSKLKLSSIESPFFSNCDYRSGKCLALQNAPVSNTLKTSKHIDPSFLPAEDAPSSVPIDEYCRYIVPLITPTASISPPLVSATPAFAEKARVPPLFVEQKEPMTGTGKVKSEKEKKGKSQSTYRPSKHLRTALHRRKTASLSANGGVFPVVPSKLEDNLTTALKKVPHAYFSKTSPVSGESLLNDVMEIHSARNLSVYTARGAMDSGKGEVESVHRASASASSISAHKSIYWKSKAEKNIALVNIEKDDILLTSEVQDVFKSKGVQKKGVTAQRESCTEYLSSASVPLGVGAEGHKLVTFEVKLPESLSFPLPDTKALSASQRPLSRKLLPEETKKITEQKHQKQLHEQKEREKLFVFPLHQAEEVQNNVDVKPEPGVQVQCLPQNHSSGSPQNLRRIRSAKDDPFVLSDGGEYIIPDNKQRWLEENKIRKVSSTKKKDVDGAAEGPRKNKSGFLSSTPSATQSLRISAQKEPLPSIQASRSGEKYSRALNRSAPKIMRSSRLAETKKNSRSESVAVAHSAAKVSQDNARLLPVITPSSRDNAAKQTRRTSLLERKRVNMVASALAEFS